MVSDPVFARGRLWLVLLTLLLTLLAGQANAITRVGVTAGVVDKTSDRSTIIPAPVGVVGGDLMLLVLSISGAQVNTITPPSSDWTQINLTSGLSHGQAVFRKWAGAAEAGTYTFTWTYTGSPGGNDRALAYIITYRNVNATTPIDAAGGQYNSTSSSTVTAPSITTTVVNTQLVGFFGLSNNSGGGTLPASMGNSYTQLTGGGSGGTTVLSGDELRPAIGATGIRAATFTSSAVSVGHLIALRPTRTFRVEAAATGAIGTQIAGTSFNIRITALKPDGTTDTTFTGTVGISSTGSLSVGSGATAAFTAGVLATHTVRISNTGTFNITATETAANNFGVSNNFLVVPKLQILVPGETAAPGTASGKTGTPTTQTPGTAFNVTVNAVDEFWNLVATATDSITLTSSDPAAVLPAAAALVSGTRVFPVTLHTSPSQTITANASLPVRSDVSSIIPLAAAVGGFNAYETGTAAGAISGVIKTKVAGTSFSLALIALNSAKTAIQTTFTGTVKVELLDSSSGGALDANGCNAGWPVIQTLATNPVFVAGDGGRKTVAFQENNAWRNVRVRVSFPATGAATAIGCSNDNFAIRPNSLGFTVTDGDWETAGTARTLNNTATPGGTVHKAGRPFTITATAYNGAGTPAITTNYAGAPTASIVSHIIPSACLSGAGCTLSGGTFQDGTANDGIVSSSTASYAEVGVFNMQLIDTTFADVDAGDSTTAERHVTSATLAVGRFVPDRFTLASGSRTPACTTGGAALSYMGQPFSVAATLVAQNFAGGTTENYHPSSGGYAPATVVWQAENADSGSDLTARLVNVGAAWSNGSYAVNSATATFNRAAAPDGPYDSLQLGVRLTDPDGPVLGGLDMNAATSGACAPSACTARTIGAPISVRYGVLRLSNAYGSELLGIRVPVRALYCHAASAGNCTDWRTSTSDACTSFTSVDASFGNYQGALNAVNFPLTRWNVAQSRTSPIGTGSGVTPGIGVISFDRPNPAAAGSVDLTLTAPSWLRGGAGTPWPQNPTSRLRFGSPKAPHIYLRERY
ncbi:MAG: hypothetical protein QMD17_12120 [Rhodocyclaceae bacterium]|nr:hypothetical protein [Rhodocyclaceae bacterium]